MKRSPAGSRRRSIDAAVTSDTDECIVWPHARFGDGYGRFRFHGKELSAHRAVLILVTGKDPADLEAAHDPETCSDRGCINPRHLRWATHAENMDDILIAGTRPTGGDAVFSNKVTEAQVHAIRAASAAGASSTEIAARFPISATQVRRIVRREQWGWLPDSTGRAPTDEHQTQAEHTPTSPAHS